MMYKKEIPDQMWFPTSGHRIVNHNVNDPGVSWEYVLDLAAHGKQPIPHMPFSTGSLIGSFAISLPVNIPPQQSHLYCLGVGIIREGVILISAIP